MLITADTSSIARLASGFHNAGGKVKRGVVSAAIKHTGDKARSGMRRALVGQTGLKYGVFVRAIKGKMGGGEYVIKSGGGNVRLKFFGARETRKGVSAAPWNSRRVYPGSFIRVGWWPHRGRAFAGGHVFRRVGKSKLPVVMVRSGLFIPEEMVKGASAAVFFSTVDRELIPRVMHELFRALPGG